MIEKIRENMSLFILGFLFIGLFSLGLFMVIKKPISSEHLFKAEQIDTIHVESTVQEPVIVEQAKPRVWKGADYGLPVGVVVGGEMDNENPTLNWLSIQQPDGHMVLVKSIDGPLWVAIQKGDIIE